MSSLGRLTLTTIGGQRPKGEPPHLQMKMSYAYTKEMIFFIRLDRALQQAETGFVNFTTRSLTSLQEFRPETLPSNNLSPKAFRKIVVSDQDTSKTTEEPLRC